MPCTFFAPSLRTGETLVSYREGDVVSDAAASLAGDNNAILSPVQDPEISVTNEALYNPANATSGLAGVGEPIKFTVSSDNVGNVDIHDVELSDDGKPVSITFVLN